MRNEKTGCHGNCERLNIRLGPFERDERTKFVEHVLDVMLESRFGPNLALAFFLFDDLVPAPEDPKHILFDLMPSGPLVSNGMRIYSRESVKTVERDLVLRRLAASSTAASQNYIQQTSPNSLARGSPHCHRTCTDLMQ